MCLGIVASLVSCGPPPEPASQQVPQVSAPLAAAQLETPDPEPATPGYSSTPAPPPQPPPSSPIVAPGRVPPAPPLFVPLGNPTRLSAAEGDGPGEIILTWDPAVNATYGFVYVAKVDGSKGRYWPIASGAGTAVITGLDPAADHVFIVIAAQEQRSGQVQWSQWSNWVHSPSYSMAALPPDPPRASSLVEWSQWNNWLQDPPSGLADLPPLPPAESAAQNTHADATVGADSGGPGTQTEGGLPADRPSNGTSSNGEPGPKAMDSQTAKAETLVIFDPQAADRILTGYGGTTEIGLAPYVSPGVTGVSFSLKSCDESSSNYYDSVSIENDTLVVKSNRLGHVHGLNTQTETTCIVTATAQGVSQDLAFRLHTVADRTPPGLPPGAISLVEARSGEVDIRLSLPGGSLGYLRVGLRKSGGQPVFHLLSGATDGMVLTIADLEPGSEYELRAYLMTAQGYDLYRAGNSDSPGVLRPEGNPDSKWVKNLPGGGLGKSQSATLSTLPDPTPPPTPLPAPGPEAVLTPTPRPTPEGENEDDDDDDTDNDGIDTPTPTDNDGTDSDGIDTPTPTDNDGTDSDGIDTPTPTDNDGTDSDGIDTPTPTDNDGTDSDGIDTPTPTDNDGTDSDGIDTPTPTDNDGTDSDGIDTPTPTDNDGTDSDGIDTPTPTDNDGTDSDGVDTPTPTDNDGTDSDGIDTPTPTDNDGTDSDGIDTPPATDDSDDDDSDDSGNSSG